MAGDLLGISVSGLRVSQSALSTTGHNISNAGVEGYSRQQVNAATNPSTLQGSGYLGTGANVESIERVVSEFVTKQMRVDSTLYNDLNTYNDYIRQLDNLLSDENSGLSSALESFFSAMHNGADDPTSIPARQLIVSESENLADRFNTVYSRFEAIESSIDKALNSAVSQVNDLAANIASLNQKVSEAIGAGNGAMPNDLLDQRDETILQLSRLVSIQTFNQSNGEVNVIVGSGQSIVVGNQSRVINLEQSESDATKLDLRLVSGASNQVITDLVKGGEIGGLLRFRDTAMTDTYNEFGRIAIAMAETFNTLHQQGVNLDNEFGGSFFRDVNDPTVASNRIIGNSNNADPGNRIMTLNIVDSNQLTPSDYSLTVESGGLFTVERLSDGVEVETGLIRGSYPYVIEFDGLELVVERGVLNAGDEFLLQPLKSGARDFASDIADPRAIAFAAPLSTGASLGNEGSGRISSGEVLSLVGQDGQDLPLLATPGELSPPLIIRFNTDDTYDVLDNSDPGSPVQLDPPLRNQRFIPNTSNAVFPTDPGETLVTTTGMLLGTGLQTSPIAGTGGTLTNGYPTEAFTFTLPEQSVGAGETRQTIYTPTNGTAREIANLLSNVEGVSANAYNYLEISNLKITEADPLQIALNGEDLLPYEFDANLGITTLAGAVPDPVTEPQAFNDFLAEQINANSSFSEQGIYAIAATDEVTGFTELQIHSTRGDDLQIDLTANANETIDINDGEHNNISLVGAGAGATSSMVVGGRFDLALSDGVSVSSFPSESMILGDTTAADFAKNRYLGIQVALTGSPNGGDDFTIDFNVDGAADNRNAILLSSLQTDAILSNGNATLADGYGSLVERIGIDTSSSTINTEASERVLEQTEQMRNSISSVNLDEEAANLIRFEQMYSANAQVISVARNLFDTLINSF